MKDCNRSFRYSHRQGCARGLYFLLTFLIFWAIIFSTFVAPPLSGCTSSTLLKVLNDFRSDSPLLSSKPQNRRPEYHVLFSSGCSLQQHWESYVFFYHAFKVNQPGNVTRLVSGCTVDEEVELRQFHEEKIRTMSERFHVFFTPNFGKGGNFKAEYKYNNKPNSVYLWMKDTLGMDRRNRTKDVEDGIIFLLDPDMILLRPLLHDFSDQEMIYVNAAKTGASRPFGNGARVVQHGMPMAQHDGYLTSEWMKFNASHITQGRKFPSFEPQEGELLWNSGPPYLITVRDMWPMVRLWKDYVPKVYEEYPKLFAEM
jgi:hypothetical protein